MNAQTVIGCRACGAPATLGGVHWMCTTCGAENRPAHSNGVGQGARASRTESRRELRKALRHLTVVQEAHERPLTRGECVNGIRPCPYAGCKYHLALEVNHTGSLKFNFEPEGSSDIEPSEPIAPRSTCALDIADDGPHTLDDVALALNITQERARQIEKVALEKLRPLTSREDI